jgi:hypothetical protein
MMQLLNLVGRVKALALGVTVGLGKAVATLPDPQRVLAEAGITLHGRNTQGGRVVQCVVHCCPGQIICIGLTSERHGSMVELQSRIVQDKDDEIKSHPQHAKPAAAAGLVLLALVSSVVIARSAETQGSAHAPHPDNAVVQDTYIDESLDYKLFLHRQARLVPPDEGAAR